MKTIYLDNFRGFSDAFVPLADVNFLVGENSTGKTSVLSALNLLVGSGLLVRPVFNTLECDLGNFDDIVSKESNETSYFTLGYSNSERKNDTAERYRELIAVVLTFCNKNGIPYLRRISFHVDNELVHAEIVDNNLFFLSYSLEGIQDFTGEQLFSQLVRDHKCLEIQKDPRTVSDKIDSDIVERSIFIVIGYIDFLKAMYARPVDEEEDKKAFSAPVHKPFQNKGSKPIWIAPIRAKPKKTYDPVKEAYSPEGNHIPGFLNEMLNGETNEKVAFIEALKKFGTESRLFKEVQVKRDSLAFEVNVILSQRPVNLAYVGYGVSQVLPVIVESFRGKEGTTLAVQQPEVHLHPKAQAALGEFFFDLAAAEGKQFLIETHSDFLVDRFRLKLKSSKKKDLTAQVLFFERSERGNTCRPIRILEDGRYDEDQPESFRDFFLDEQIKLLDI
jgi:predicted ATPase